MTFLGHSIFSSGNQPDLKKVKDFDRMPTPTDVSQLLSLLEGLPKYRNSLPNLAKLQ